MSLFQWKTFVSASGELLPFKIECDALSEEDWEALAQIMLPKLPHFGMVEGVPMGGMVLARCLSEYVRPSSSVLLVVDDVYTTGGSMERHRNGRGAIGAVVFAHNPVTQPWIWPLFQMQTAKERWDDRDY